MGSLRAVKVAAPNKGAGTRYLELVREGLSKEEAARRALAEVGAKRRAS